MYNVAEECRYGFSLVLIVSIHLDQRLICFVLVITTTSFSAKGFREIGCNAGNYHTVDVTM